MFLSVDRLSLNPTDLSVVNSGSWQETLRTKKWLVNRLIHEFTKSLNRGVPSLPVQIDHRLRQPNASHGRNQS
jgi:hypothetical protein